MVIDMKKFFLFVAILLLCGIAPIVKAEESTALYCEYEYANSGSGAAYYMLLELYSSNADTFDYEFKTIPDGNDVYTEIAPNNRASLEIYRILENGNLQCPSLAVESTGNKAGALILWSEADGDDKLLSVSKQECPSTGCAFLDIPEIPDDGSCEYTGNSGKILVEPTNKFNECKVTYPDGTTEIRTDICSVTITKACTDLFYNKRTKDFLKANTDYAKTFKTGIDYDPVQHEFICGSDKDNVEYYCAGTCNFPNNKSIDCKALDKKIVGANPDAADLSEICTESGVLKAMRFIGYLLYIAKVLVPVVLIIMGSLDFGKAVMASNQDAIKKSTSAFISRIIAGVLIFLLPTMVNFVFSLLPSSVSDYSACRTCLFHPGECNIND